LGCESLDQVAALGSLGRIRCAGNFVGDAPVLCRCNILPP